MGKSETVAQKLRRWVLESERDDTFPSTKMRHEIGDRLSVRSAERDAFLKLANETEREVLNALSVSLRTGTEIYAKANDLPPFKNDEDFGAWLHRCFLPRPRYEDGEPVQFGSETDKLNGVEKFIFTRSGRGCCQMQDAEGNIHNAYPSERVKRPFEVLLQDGKPVAKGEIVYIAEDASRYSIPDKYVRFVVESFTRSGRVTLTGVTSDGDERYGFAQRGENLTHEPPVLDADGVPIKIGDTVWLVQDKAHMADSDACARDIRCGLLGIDANEPLIVESLDGRVKDRVCFTECNAWCPASWLTHTQPDTQERIDRDARKSFERYWGCQGYECSGCPAAIDGKDPCERYGVCNCHDAQTLDLLRRQRELDDRKGDAE